MSHYDVDEEVRLIHFHVYRIAQATTGGLTSTFANVFNDPQVEQTFESLVGTLKAAKKRGILDFPGMLLLMPTHKDVIITLKEPYSDDLYKH